MSLEERVARIEKHLEKTSSFSTLKKVLEYETCHSLKEKIWMAKPVWARYLLNTIDFVFLDITMSAYAAVPVIVFFILVGVIYANPDKVTPTRGWMSLIGFYVGLYTFRNAIDRL
jgi:hypothetical protein